MDQTHLTHSIFEDEVRNLSYSPFTSFFQRILTDNWCNRVQIQFSP